MDKWVWLRQDGQVSVVKKGGPQMYRIDITLDDHYSEGSWGTLHPDMHIHNEYHYCYNCDIWQD